MGNRHWQNKPTATVLVRKFVHPAIQIPSRNQRENNQQKSERKGKETDKEKKKQKGIIMILQHCGVLL